MSGDAWAGDLDRLACDLRASRGPLSPVGVHSASEGEPMVLFTHETEAILFGALRGTRDPSGLGIAFGRAKKVEDGEPMSDLPAPWREAVRVAVAELSRRSAPDGGPSP